MADFAVDDLRLLRVVRQVLQEFVSSEKMKVELGLQPDAGCQGRLKEEQKSSGRGASEQGSEWLDEKSAGRPDEEEMGPEAEGVGAAEALPSRAADSASSKRGAPGVSFEAPATPKGRIPARRQASESQEVGNSEKASATNKYGSQTP